MNGNSNAPSFQGFLISDLRDAFSKIQNPKDWKDEIDAWIDESDLACAKVACQFYTATTLTVVEQQKTHLRRNVRVVADGYRKGPAGP